MLNYLTNGLANYIGYTVITSKRKIICILNNDYSCCEIWDVEYTIEETLQLRTPSIVINFEVDLIDESYDEGSAVKLEIVDYKTKHIITLWNSHNGYYPHNYFIYDSTG